MSRAQSTPKHYINNAVAIFANNERDRTSQNQRAWLRARLIMKIKSPAGLDQDYLCQHYIFNLQGMKASVLPCPCFLPSTWYSNIYCF